MANLQEQQIQELLRRGDILGTQASQRTGISYTPVARTLEAGPPLTTQPIKNLQLEERNPVALATQNQNLSQGVSSSVPKIDISRMLEIIRSYQQYGRDIESDVEKEQAERGLAPLPSSLAGLELSGAQQLRFRKGEVEAVEPTLGGIRSLIRESDSLATNWERIQREENQKNEQIKSDARWLISRVDDDSNQLESLFQFSPEIFDRAGILNPQSYIENKKLLEANKVQKTTADTVEYDLARSQGYKGSFLDYQNLYRFGSGAGISDIENYAQRLNAGQVDIRNIPQNIRGSVLSKAKEFATVDLEEDITAGSQQGITREALINQLTGAYPEFTKAEVSGKVYKLIPDKPAAAPNVSYSANTPSLLGQSVNLTKSFFDRLFAR